MNTRIEAYKPEHLALIVGREYEREMPAVARAAGLCTWNSFCKAAPDGTFIKITEDCGQSETLK